MYIGAPQFLRADGQVAKASRGMMTDDVLLMQSFEHALRAYYCATDKSVGDEEGVCVTA
jgi:hypothetical protein